MRVGWQKKKCMICFCLQGAIKLKCSSSLLTIYWQSSMVSVIITTVIIIIITRVISNITRVISGSSSIVVILAFNTMNIILVMTLGHFRWVLICVYNTVDS